MEDLHAVGGIPAVMKMLLEAGLLHGDCLTVTGKTLEENLQDLPGLKRGPADRAVRSRIPSKPPAICRSCKGNLAPEGAVAKITGKEGLSFSGPANVFDSEEAMLEALEDRKDRKGRCHRHPLRGPKGRPRHAGDVDAYLGDYGRRTGEGRGLDHRWPLFRRLARIHRRPRNAGGAGGRTDCAGAQRGPHHHRATKNELSVALSDEETQPPRRKWHMPPYKATRGTLGKYIRLLKTPASVALRMSSRIRARSGASCRAADIHGVITAAPLTDSSSPHGAPHSPDREEKS